MHDTGTPNTVSAPPDADGGTGGVGGSDAGPLGGGPLLAEITNRFVALMREHYGRGPTRAKTYLLDNLVVCVVSGDLSPVESTLMEGGGGEERVLDLRRHFQGLMRERYSGMIEELSGRHVTAFLSQTHVEPDLTVAMFLMDGPLPGFGALEVADG